MAGLGTRGASAFGNWKVTCRNAVNNQAKRAVRRKSRYLLLLTHLQSNPENRAREAGSSPSLQNSRVRNTGPNTYQGNAFRAIVRLFWKILPMMPTASWTAAMA
jgi:hypothetical protein